MFGLLSCVCGWMPSNLLDDLVLTLRMFFLCCSNGGSCSRVINNGDGITNGDGICSDTYECDNSELAGGNTADDVAHVGGVADVGGVAHVGVSPLSIYYATRISAFVTGAIFHPGFPRATAPEATKLFFITEVSRLASTGQWRPFKVREGGTL